MPSPCFPPTGPRSDAPLPSAGSARVAFPGFNGTIRALRLPAARPAALRCLRLAVPAFARSLRSHQRGVRRRGPGVFALRSGCPFRIQVETTGPPAFLGNPNCALALLSDPGGTATPSHYDVPARPPRCPRRRFPQLVFRGSITRLRHSLSTLRSVGYPSTTQDSLPAVGQTLPDGLATRRAPTKGLGLLDIHGNHPPFPSFAAQGQPPRTRDSRRPKAPVAASIDTSPLQPALALTAARYTPGWFAGDRRS